MKEAPVLAPAYMQNFRCLGAACPATCCHGPVDIDRRTYRKYELITDKDLKAKLAAVLKAKPAGERKDSAYARLGEMGKACAFLQDGMCEIQRNLGEGYLGNTCHTVPRRVNILGGVREISARLLCPEAVRLLLADQAPLSFDLTVGHIDPRHHIATDADGAGGMLQPHLFEVRSLAIDILQDRRYPFHERMLRLGAFTSEIDRHTGEQDAAQLPEFLAGIQQGFSVQLDPVNNGVRPLDYIAFVNKLHVQPLLKAREERYRRWLACFCDGLAIGEDVTPETGVAYAASCEKLFRPFLAGHEYIFEHFFVHYAFSRIYPLRSAGTAMDEYYKMLWYYIIMNILLVGIAASRRELSTELVGQFLPSFGQYIETAITLEPLMLDIIKDSHLNNLPSIYALLSGQAAI